MCEECLMFDEYAEEAWGMWERGWKLDTIEDVLMEMGCSRGWWVVIECDLVETGR